MSQIRCQIDQRPNHVTCIIEQSSQNVLSPSSTGEVLWWCSLILPTLMKGIRIPYSLDCQWERLLGYATTCQRALESGNSAEDTTLFKLDRLNIIDFQVQTGKSRLHHIRMRVRAVSIKFRCSAALRFHNIQALSHTFGTAQKVNYRQYMCILTISLRTFPCHRLGTK